jgi:hypothetical protein
MKKLLLPVLLLTFMLAACSSKSNLIGGYLPDSPEATVVSFLDASIAGDYVGASRYTEEPLDLSGVDAADAEMALMIMNAIFSSMTYGDLQSTAHDAENVTILVEVTGKDAEKIIMNWIGSLMGLDIDENISEEEAKVLAEEQLVKALAAPDVPLKTSMMSFELELINDGASSRWIITDVDGF